MTLAPVEANLRPLSGTLVGSSNGRTADFGSAYRGSIPFPTTTRLARSRAASGGEGPTGAHGDDFAVVCAAMLPSLEYIAPPTRSFAVTQEVRGSRVLVALVSVLVASGCGAQGGQRFMDDPRALQGSGSVGSETLRPEGQGPVALPTDIRVQPYPGVVYALNSDQPRRVIGWVNPAEVEQVSSSGTGWDARYLVPVANAPVQGPADALVTIVFFVDFSSPHCAAMFDAIKNIRLRFGRDLRVVYKLRPGDTDERAHRAAIAAVEAYRQKGADGFVAMAEQLFNRTDDLTFAHLVDAAARVELEPRTFTLALRYQSHANFVAADVTQADSAQVRDVPTLFINGRRNVGVSTERLVESMIDREVVNARARLSAGIPRQRLYESILDPPPTERAR